MSTSVLTVPGQRRRNSVSPSSLNITKKDTFASARRWIQQSFVIDPTARIRKGDVFIRYALFVDQSGEGGVAETTLGKYIKELFPNVASRRTTGADAHTFFEGIQWADAPPPDDPQQQQQHDWGEILSRLKTSTPTLTREP